MRRDYRAHIDLLPVGAPTKVQTREFFIHEQKTVVVDPCSFGLSGGCVRRAGVVPADQRRKGRNAYL
jgi:hypothetical protein